MIFRVILTSAILLLLAGCETSVGSYQSKQSYAKPLFSELAERSFDYEGPLRNPVIVVHGLLGAKLRDDTTGKEFWGTFSPAAQTWKEMHMFAHPMGIGRKLSELTNGTSAYTMLDHANIQLMGFSFSVSGYSELIELLQKCGYYSDAKPLPPGKNFFSQFFFYYDWRRDIPENAARFHRFILEKRAYIQQRYRELYGLSDYDVKFDIVAHSMGGLLSRYYLRYGGQDLPADGVSLPYLDWSGSRYVDKLMVIGTPNAGYLDTILEMTRGLQLAPGASVYPPALIGTFPSLYQMLPHPEFRPVVWEDDPGGPAPDIFDPGLWRDMKWSLADPGQDAVLQILLPEVRSAEERRRIALDHQAKCLRRARQFTRALSIPASHPDNVMPILFAGDAVATVRELKINRQTGKLTVSRYDAGDGKILSSSARYDRLSSEVWQPFIDSPIDWHCIYHVRAAHMGLIYSEEFAHNLRFNILMMPTAIQKEKMRQYMDSALRRPRKMPRLPR